MLSVLLIPCCYVIVMYLNKDGFKLFSVYYQLGITRRAPLGNLGLWDYNLFESGITEISFEIGIMYLKSNQIGIFHTCKLGLRDFILFEIGIMGLRPGGGGVLPLTKVCIC